MSEQDSIVVQSQAVPVMKGTSFTGDVLKLVSGTTFAQIISILASPLLTRLYAPEAYGVFALFVSITSILGVIACLRYELSIMLPESDEEATNLLGVSLVFAVLISLLTMPIICWGKAYLLRWLNATELSPYVWLVPLAVFASGVFLALNYWNYRTKHFGRLSIARVTTSLATTSMMLGAGYAGYATGGTMIGVSVGGQAIVTTVLGSQIWRDDRKLFLQSINWWGIWSGIKRFRKFPLIDIWGALLNNISWQLPVLLLTLFFSQTLVGFYALAFRLIHLPMSLIGASLGNVFYQRASELKGDLTKLANITEMVFKRLVALSFFPALLLSVIGRESFSVVFGHQWAEAGTYAQILSIWMFCWFISSPLSTIFALLERQGLAFIVHLTIFITRIVSLYLGGIYKDVYLGLWLFSISGTVVYGGLAFLNLKLAGVRLKIISLILFHYLCYALPATGFLLLLKALNMGPFWLTCIAIVELIIYYPLVMKNDLRRFWHFSSAIPLFKGKVWE
jgi:O-antigen/teichoic acid export membrane protein